jgi:dolichol kinase
MDKETGRQLFHLIVGLFALGLLLHFGRSFTAAAVFIVIIIGTLLMNLRLLGFKIPLVTWFEKNFEREGAKLPGWGSACYAAGNLMLLTFLTDTYQIAACMIILALGDSVSTIIGRLGKNKIPYNGSKTIEGSLAFFIASLSAFLFIGPSAIALAALATVVESIPELEDNLTIPIACIALMLIL